MGVPKNFQEMCDEEYEETLVDIAKTYEVPSFLAGMKFASILIEGTGELCKNQIRGRILETAGKDSTLTPELLQQTADSAEAMINAVLHAQKDDFDGLMEMLSSGLSQNKARCTDANFNRLVQAFKKGQ